MLSPAVTTKKSQLFAGIFQRYDPLLSREGEGRGFSTVSSWVSGRAFGLLLRPILRGIDAMNSDKYHIFSKI